MRLTTANRRVFISALIVGFGFLVSKVTGFLDDRILVQTIGLNPALDAYYAASLLPDLLFTLVSGGALAAALIPMLSGFLARDDRAGAWKLTSAVVNTAFVIALGGASIMAIFAPWFVAQTVAHGFTPENQQLTANLMRVLLVGTIVFSISGVVMSALQANQHFFLTALAPIMYNLGILGGVIFLAPRLGVWGPAIGMVIGALLHLLIQVPGLIKYRARWTAWLGWHDAALRRVIRLMIPRVIQLGVVQVASLVITSIASTLPIGSVTALSNGWKVMQVPETLIATAIATAAFPTLSELASRGQIRQLRNMLYTTLLVILAMTVPATFSLLLFSTQVVSFLYDASPGMMTLITWAVHGYALGLIGHSMLEVSARTFYAQQDTRTPLIVAVIAMIVGITASWGMRNVLGVGGLALANSIGVTVEVLALLALLRRRLNPAAVPEPPLLET